MNCTEHQVEAWRTRDRPIVQRVRGRKLQALRAQLFARQPICAVCRTRFSTIRDHIIPLAEGGRDDASNTQGLCASCSKVKTEVESKRGVARR